MAEELVDVLAKLRQRRKTKCTIYCKKMFPFRSMLLYSFFGLKEVIKVIERFSFECRKVTGFAFTTLRDWLKRFAPLFYPIRRKTKTNCVTLACIFPRFASATCNYFTF